MFEWLHPCARHLLLNRQHPRRSDTLVMLFRTRSRQIHKLRQKKLLRHQEGICLERYYHRDRFLGEVRGNCFGLHLWQFPRFWNQSILLVWQSIGWGKGMVFNDFVLCRLHSLWFSMMGNLSFCLDGFLFDTPRRMGHVNKDRADRWSRARESKSKALLAEFGRLIALWYSQQEQNNSSTWNATLTRRLRHCSQPLVLRLSVASLGSVVGGSWFGRGDGNIGSVWIVRRICR